MDVTEHNCLFLEGTHDSPELILKTVLGILVSTEQRVPWDYSSNMLADFLVQMTAK